MLCVFVLKCVCFGCNVLRGVGCLVGLFCCVCLLVFVFDVNVCGLFVMYSVMLYADYQKMFVLVCACVSVCVNMNVCALFVI